MAPSWCTHCDSCNGSRYAYGEKASWTRQVVTLARFSGGPGHPRRFRPNQELAATNCGRCIAHVACSIASHEGDQGKRQRQRLLWKPFFQDPTQWLDNRQQKGNPDSPGFRHKEPGKALCLDNCYKPACVDAQLPTLDVQTDNGAHVARLSSHHPDQLVGLGFENCITPEFVKKLCKQGQVKGAVEALEVLCGTHCRINRYLLHSVLKECVAKKDLMLGGQVHALAIKVGFGTDTFLCNHFIRMYASHGKLQEAMDVFTGVALPDAFMWSSIISAYAKQGQAERAVQLYKDMLATRTKPDNHVFAAALHACGAARDLQCGKQLHSQVKEHKLESDKVVGGSLVNMYAKCGSLKDARSVFEGLHEKDVVTWTVMISGYAKLEGMGQDALTLHSAMHNEGMVIPDAVAYVCLLQACANVGVSALEKGRQLHSQIIDRGLEFDMVVGGSLVNMYAKCGSLYDARSVFEELREKNVVTWSAMIAGYAKAEGMGQYALSLYSAMNNEGLAIPNVVTFVCLLQACANVGVAALEKGKQLHSELKDLDLASDVVVGGSLVNMYAKCGSLSDARTVFDGLHDKNLVAWNAMISGYAKVEGMGLEALSLYRTMRNEGQVIPDDVTFVCLLQACANLGVSALESGKQLHSQLKYQGLESNVIVGCSLVNMYAKCGSLTDARFLFDRLGEKNVVTWTVMIAGYAKVEGMGQDALSLYSAMQNEGITVPDAVTFVCLLQACANVGVSALHKGKQLHSEVNERGLQSEMAVGGSLVNMYAKCGSLTDARSVFDGLREKNVVAWNAMIAGYANVEDMGHNALNLYSAMHNEGKTMPDAVTFVCLLQACANVGVTATEKGKQLHSQIKERGLESDMAVGGSLVNMYAKCGSLADARTVFDRLGEKDVVTWTAMIAGYAGQEGMGQEALNIHSAMCNEGMAIPNAVTYVCLLEACANVGVPALEKGKQLHSRIKERGLEFDMAVGGSLVNMYAKCGSLNDAKTVFDKLSEKNVVTWTSMIAGYAEQKGMGLEALNIYKSMRNKGMATPNAVTYVCLLEACANLGGPALEEGKKIHFEIQERGFDTDMAVGGSLVNMYAKCGSLLHARTVFDGLREKHVVTWTAMIAGYAQQEGMGQEALNMYSAMRNKGIGTPDAVTYVCLLEACTRVGALQQGKELHSEIREGGLESNVLIGTCLVKMYAQCGHLDVSRGILDRLRIRSVEAWTALLKGYAEHGEGGMAILLFEELVEQGIQPNEVTFICLLTACSHAGLVYEGLRYFESMEERHGVKPDEWHYTCMVDLLGRSGHLDRAEQMLQASGLAGGVVSWTALLSACKSYGDAALGRRCFDHLVNLQPTVATAYVLLQSIYADAGRWDEVERVEILRKAAGAWKKAAKACIEVKKEVLEFTVGEERSDVAVALRKMNERVKDGGHVPQTQLVLRAVTEQEREDALCGHAEKLALAYGLLNTPAGSPLLVTKNLRMCNDCHSSTKIMSGLEKRKIVVRDGHKVHRFQNGVCSCQDRP